MNCKELPDHPARPLMRTKNVCLHVDKTVVKAPYEIFDYVGQRVFYGNTAKEVLDAFYNSHIERMMLR